ncbi:hypothetical protein EC973_003020 [Apophysomyces ossiformis]|uniref:Uncharacterized protein n=1 Tax=Apophysomyces ossiformis TaxID=679940 RepID=A0A8H7BXG6_9FUNG|nr:hypothetical protein EC973_003020 [Apophysomyces ossiformis]
MDRKKIGTWTDMIFTMHFAELGTFEDGRKNDINSKKSLEEIGVKCPKTLKDMFLQLAKRSPNNLRKLSTHAFVTAGLFFNLLMLDCPAGYVCRISTLPAWLQYPVSEAEFAKGIIPIIQSVWHAKRSMEATLEIVEMDNAIQALSFIPQKEFLPPVFSLSNNNGNKKRKADNANM